MHVSQCNVLLTKIHLCVRDYLGLSSLSPVSPSFLHACRKDFPVKDMAQWVHLSPPFGLSLSQTPSVAESLSLLLPCEHRPAHRATKSSLLSNQAREPLLPSPLPERRPWDTNRTWHPERGWRWRRKREKKCTRSYLPTPLSCVSLIFSNLESLRLQSPGEETHIDIEFVTHDDSRWRHLRRDTTLIWRFM